MDPSTESVVKWLGSQYSVLALQSKKRKSRFSLLQLEHGELFLLDYGVVWLRGGRQAQAGRLKCCSRSLVFEPTEPRLPLVKFSLASMRGTTTVEERQSGGHRDATSGIEMAGNPDRIVFECEGAVEMSSASGAAQPYAASSATHGGGAFEFAPEHTSVEELWRTTEGLRRAAAETKKLGPHAEAGLLESLVAPLRSAKFELRQLVDYTEDVVLQLPAERVTPLLRQPGVAAVTTRRLYFEPAPLNDVGDAKTVCDFAEIAACRKARHMMEHRALEVLIGATDDSSSSSARNRVFEHNASSSLYGRTTSAAYRKKDCLRLAFKDTASRDACFQALFSALGPARCVDDSKLLNDATRAWTERNLDTYAYLAVVNFVADRSLHDLSQYPVYPWVLSDFESTSLNLDSAETYRDLSKPVGALDAARFADFRDRFEAMALQPSTFADPRPHRTSSPTLDAGTSRGSLGWGSSTGKSGQTPPKLSVGRVRSFVADRLSVLRGSASSASLKGDTTPPRDSLSEAQWAEASSTSPPTAAAETSPPEMEDPRDKPFLYGTHFSTPGYVAFYLVRAAPEYTLCLQNGRFDAPDRMFVGMKRAWKSVLANATDLKELVPEFYDGDGGFLVNARNVPLGTTQAGENVGDVQLPPWASSASDLVAKMRAGLESDAVAAALPSWLDLVFGCRQGDPDNLFHPLTYESNVVTLRARTDLDPRDLVALDAQIDEFGQTPTRVFRSPHPHRRPASSSRSAAPRFQHQPNPRNNGFGTDSLRAASVSTATTATTALPDTFSSYASSSSGSRALPTRRTSPLDAVGVSPLDASKLLAASSNRPVVTSGGPPPAPARDRDDADRNRPNARSSERSPARSGGVEIKNSSGHAPPNASFAEAPLPAPAPERSRRPVVPDAERSSESALPRRRSPNPPHQVLGGATAAQPSSSSLRPARPARAPAPRVTGLKAIDKSHTRAHRDALTGVACAGDVVASTSRDGTLKIGGVEPGRWFAPRRTLAAPSRAPLASVCLTPDGRLALTAGVDARLSVYGVDSGQLVSSVAAHEAPATACRCCRATSQVGVHDVATGGLDAAVKIWRLGPDGRLESDEAALELYDHETPVQCVALRDQTNLVAAGAEDGLVLVWDARGGDALGRAKLDDAVVAVAVVSGPRSGDVVFAADASGAVLQLSLHGQLLARFDLRDDLTDFVVCEARPLGESAPGRPDVGPFLFVAAGDGDVHLLDWSDPRRPTALAKRKGHASAVAALALVNQPSQHSDSDLLEVALVSAAEDCTLKAWDIIRQQHHQSSSS